MARVAILLPQEQMCALAAPLVPEYKNISLVCLDCISYSDAHQVVSRAYAIETQGCDLFIARGVQARMIKYNTSIPVVEIQITAQELGLVLLEIKKELGLVRPKIALICFDNMVGDTSHFSELFDIDWRTYFVSSSEELADTVGRAALDGCRAVIGGHSVCERARQIGVVYRFLPTSPESIRNALITANNVCYAIDQEKRNLTEMDTMLNNTFSGIMQVDEEGKIRRINRTGCAIINMMAEELVGRKAADILPDLTQRLMEDALRKGEESYAFVMNIQMKAVVVNIAPIEIEGRIKGAILTFQEGKRVFDMDSELRSEVYQRGFIARYDFDRFIARSKESQSLVRTARLIAKYTAPVFLTGESGAGKSILAQCLHRESLFKKGAFVSVDCSAWQAAALDELLFGRYPTVRDEPLSMVQLAQNGTLYLSHVEYLSPETQYKVLRLIKGQILNQSNNMIVSANVRVIASTACSLIARVERGAFRRDLYYALNVLSLEIPPLRRRREDIEGWFEYYLNAWQEKYKRYAQPTSGARKYISEYDWPGNLDQVCSVCERIILMMEKRSIDEVFIRRQIEFVTPLMTEDKEKVVVVENPKSLEIMKLLSEHGGNREEVASAMGISKTTLWRYMKKYGIEAGYGK